MWYPQKFCPRRIPRPLSRPLLSKYRRPMLLSAAEPCKFTDYRYVTVLLEMLEHHPYLCGSHMTTLFLATAPRAIARGLAWEVNEASDKDEQMMGPTKDVIWLDGSFSRQAEGLNLWLRKAFAQLTASRRASEKAFGLPLNFNT
ncbi:hypothetical protein BU16DRAFT_545393 [Lophium mytilinum]|uniref:Uncharacterized protein n=1 Tax=Lophium mytilinum TaxID=390894 RepID=A0A6A6Q7F9_9PEZI|nr:hypothetical protein BU16DRAFT_545393 [Lophium mytilinum]